MPHLKQKMGFLGMINLSSWSSCFSQKQPSLPENRRIPLAVWCNRPTLFSSRRFESVKANKLDSPHNTGDPQVFHLLLLFKLF